MGLETVGLFGTRFTMQGGFYQEVFSDYGVRVVVPRPDEQDYIHERYMTELVNGVFLESTRDGLTAIVGTMKERDAVQGIVLGGTELPLILTGDRRSAESVGCDRRASSCGPGCTPRR